MCVEYLPVELTEAGQDGAVFAKKTSRSSNPGGLDAFENLKQFFCGLGTYQLCVKYMPVEFI